MTARTYKGYTIELVDISTRWRRDIYPNIYRADALFVASLEGRSTRKRALKRAISYIHNLIHFKE
jgi:hypothetical protein